MGGCAVFPQSGPIFLQRCLGVSRFFEAHQCTSRGCDCGSCETRRARRPDKRSRAAKETNGRLGSGAAEEPEKFPSIVLARARKTSYLSFRNEFNGGSTK